ncbi:MAG: dihydroxyacetone kinase, partial [Mycobacteriales bacterium]
AGGRGLVVLLDALAGVLTGSEAQPAPESPRPPSPMTGHDGESSDYDYEVQYLLDADDEAAAALRTELAPLGDSLLIAGTGDGLFNVHVHVNDPGAAVEAGVRAGRPYRITITRFADESGTPPRFAERAVVAVADGDGLKQVFRDEGAEVVTGGPGRAPSTSELLLAIRRTRSGQVVLLPNDGNTHSAAGAAAEEARTEGRTVAVLPTRSPVQGLAAMAVRDPQRRFADDVIAMAEAVGATRCGAVAVAQRDSLTSAGQCRTGDVLGIIDGDVLIIGTDAGAVACDVVDRLLTGGGEMVTIVVGEDAGVDLGQLVQQHVGRHGGAIESAVFQGDQPHYPLLIGVE